MLCRRSGCSGAAEPGTASPEMSYLIAVRRARALLVSVMSSQLLGEKSCVRSITQRYRRRPAIAHPPHPRPSVHLPVGVVQVHRRLSQFIPT